MKRVFALKLFLMILPFCVNAKSVSYNNDYILILNSYKDANEWSENIQDVVARAAYGVKRLDIKAESLSDFSSI